MLPEPMDASGSRITVSVIIPTHNRPELLREALASILSQTQPPTEIIIVDDASNPPATLPFGRDDIVIRLLRHEEKRGGAAAKNTGIKVAQGELIAFLDDDDLWAPDYLEQASTLLSGHTDIDILFMAVDWFGRNAEGGKQRYTESMNKLLADADGKRIEPGILGFSDGLAEALLQRVPMAFQRPVVRCDALQKIGDYTENCLLWDCDWALRAALHGKVALCETPLYRQRMDAQGYSSRPSRLIEQTRSNIEIRERLLINQIPNNAVSKSLYRAIKRSVRQNWHHLAYQLHRQGDNAAALKAWARSLHLRQTPNFRLLIRILFNLREQT